jgi:hypothetical protein
MTQTLYRFYWDVHSQGDIESLFIADDEAVDAVLGMNVYFGEVLGKHSEVYGTLDAEDLTIVSQEPGVIADLVRLFASDSRAKHGTICGLNPLHYLRDDEGDEVEFPLKLVKTDPLT